MNPSMNPAAASAPAGTQRVAAGATPSNQAETDARLQHLFRASLRDGRIHPLYLPMLKYRHARPAP